MIYIIKTAQQDDYLISLRTRFMLFIHQEVDYSTATPDEIEDIIDAFRQDFQLKLIYESANKTMAADEGVKQDYYTFDTIDTSSSTEYSLITINDGLRNGIDNISVHSLPIGQYRYELYTDGNLIGDGRMVVRDPANEIKLTGPSTNPLESLAI